MIRVMSGRVTVSDARALDRALVLLHQGKISYGRWVETLDAWARGEEVSSWNYEKDLVSGSVVKRIAAAFRGHRLVTSSSVAHRLGISQLRAAQELSRMFRRGLASRTGIGVYSFEGRR